MSLKAQPPARGESVVQTNKKLTLRWLEQVWNRQRQEAIDEMMAVDAAVHGFGEPITGAAGFKPFHAKMLAAFPDMTVEVHHVLGDGDLTSVRFTVRATHRGDSLGFAATGRPIVTTGRCQIRWRDGIIVEGHNEFDSAGVIAALANV